MAEEFKPQYNFTDDRLNELKQLFPEALEDGVFNVDTLKTLIGEYSTDNNIKEHFGLNWVGKQDARKIAAKPPTGTLKPCPGEGVNEDNTENIFIEGENLEVLKILRKSYIGKIKMIYIDPPYNTGNDFIYKDTFADSTEDYLRKTGDKSDEGLLVSNPKSSGKYHANWLSFMYPRLRLAKDLLKDDGVIFISIDDNEVDNLRLLCDEIFGEENSLGIITLITGANQSGDGVLIQKNTEYILAYAKTRQKCGLNRVDKVEESYRNLNDAPSPLSTRLEMGYTLYWNKETNEIIPKHDYDKSKVELNTVEDVYSDDTNLISKGFIPLRPGFRENKLHRWRWGIDTFIERINQIEVINKGGNYTPVFKQSGFNPPKNYMSFSVGTSEVKKLFNGIKVFDYPKSTRLMDYLISIGSSDNDFVLDFFSGSGTTGHSVFKSIQKRKFILVQLPQIIDDKSDVNKNAIKCLKELNRPINISELSKERLRRAIYDIDRTLSFRVFKQHKSTIYKWQDFVPQKDGIIPDLFSKLELAFKNPLLDGTKPQDFITEVILQEGFPLTAQQEEVISGIFKITHEWVPYTLYVSMFQSFKNIDLDQLKLQESDHFICLDKAFESNDALKQAIDNQCKLFTI